MKEWNQFMKNMANLAKEKYRNGEIYVHYKYRREEIDRILDGCLLEDQKEIVDAFLQNWMLRRVENWMRYIFREYWTVFRCCGFSALWHKLCNFFLFSPSLI